jgi:hypothetical protein
MVERAAEAPAANGAPPSDAALERLLVTLRKTADTDVVGTGGERPQPAGQLQDEEQKEEGEVADLAVAPAAAAAVSALPLPDERGLFVDSGVYTRNRCFRMAMSCKYGKSAFLVPNAHFAFRVAAPDVSMRGAHAARAPRTNMFAHVAGCLVPASCGRRRAGRPRGHPRALGSAEHRAPADVCSRRPVALVLRALLLARALPQRRRRGGGRRRRRTASRRRFRVGRDVPGRDRVSGEQRAPEPRRAARVRRLSPAAGPARPPATPYARRADASRAARASLFRTGAASCCTRWPAIDTARTLGVRTRQTVSTSPPTWISVRARHSRGHPHTPLTIRARARQGSSTSAASIPTAATFAALPWRCRRWRWRAGTRRGTLRLYLPPASPSPEAPPPADCTVRSRLGRRSNPVCSISQSAAPATAAPNGTRGAFLTPFRADRAVCGWRTRALRSPRQPRACTVIIGAPRSP